MQIIPYVINRIIKGNTSVCTVLLDIQEAVKDDVNRVGGNTCSL